MNPYSQGQALPGLEFFQSLLKGAGMPSGFASWMAPTMDPQELEQKITDLKAVLAWLEANARLTQTTIQALEVQRMTLAALKTMNVDLGGLAGRMSEAMQAGADAMGAAAGAAAQATATSRPAAPEPAPAVEPEPTTATAGQAPAAADGPLPGMMDPMQWWNAVSQQFTQVATQALRDSPWPMPPEPGAAKAAAADARPAPAPAKAPAGKPRAAAKPAAGAKRAAPKARTGGAR